MTEASRKSSLPLDPVLQLDPDDEVFGFKVRDIPSLTREDVALAITKAERFPTSEEMRQLILTGYKGAGTKAPSRNAQTLLDRYIKLNWSEPKR